MRHTWRAGILLAATFGTGAAIAAPVLTFDTAFAAKGEPDFLHYRVLFRSGGAVHRMEVWREHDRRIKRVTDDAIETYAFRPSARDPGYNLSVLDLKRRVHTLVDRTNLYRIGQFSDWFDLGHGLRHPHAAYALAAGSAPAGAPGTPAPCRWYDLKQGQQATRICWDAKNRLPLLIYAGNGQLVWRVTATDTRPFAASVFAIHDQGFVRNDANRDISPD
jgi:hypothetical protein